LSETRGQPEEDPEIERALDEAARLVYARYQSEIVEGLDFCPFAARAREDGAVRVTVCGEAQPTHERVLSIADALASDGAIEIGLVLFTRVSLGRMDWHRFVAELHDLDAKTARPLSKQFAAAAFHPDAEPDLGSPARLVSFVRRTPDPTIQFVRHSVLVRMRSRDPAETKYVPPDQLEAYVRSLASRTVEERVPLAERIARANLDTVRTQGVAKVAAILDDILRDRDERYAPLGVAPRRPR